MIVLGCENEAGKKCGQGKMTDEVTSSDAIGTVLVADDEETVCEIARFTLENIGYSVRTAADGREAVDVFSRYAGEIICVVLDLTMPDVSGEQAYREIRGISPDIKVIFSSGYSEKEAKSNFSCEGINGFIRKPYRSSLLINAVQCAIGSMKCDDRDGED